MPSPRCSAGFLSRLAHLRHASPWRGEGLLPGSFSLCVGFVAMRHLGVIVLAPSIRGFRGLGIPIRARFGVLTRRYCAFWSACCGQRPRATFEGGYSASSANTARPVPRRTFATLLFRFAFWFSSWAHLISQTWPVSQKRMVSRPPDAAASRQGNEFPAFDTTGMKDGVCP
jgi:hypothetical protein